MGIVLPSKIEEILEDFLWQIPLNSQSFVYRDSIGSTQYEILVKGQFPDGFPRKLQKALTDIKENNLSKYHEILTITKKIKVGRDMGKTESGLRVIGHAIPSAGVMYLDGEYFKNSEIWDLSQIIYHETKHLEGLDEHSALRSEFDYFDDMIMATHPEIKELILKLRKEGKRKIYSRI